MNPPTYQINISGGAYLRVELPDLSYVYTLGRQFKIDGSGILMTEENYPLYQHIPLTPPYTTPLMITETGEVKELISGVWTHIGQITAVLFSNPDSLNDLGNGYFAKTSGSGDPNPGNPGDPGPFENIKTYYQMIYNPLKPYPHAVMKVQPADYNDVLTLARTVSSSMTVNSAIYSLPDPALAVIDAQADELQNLIAEVENGSHMKTELRNQASEQLYHLLQEETIYVNKVGNGDRGILELSGFSVSDPPNPRPVPEQIVVKRIEDGPHPHTAKIFIEPMGQTSLIYEVQTTLTPDDEASWKEALITSNSHELLIPNRIHGQEVWYRLNASNAAGAGLWSNPISFISQH